MSDLILTIHIPEALVARAQAIDLSLVEHDSVILAAFERAEAFKGIELISRKLQALPNDEKPTPDEIDAEFRAYWQDRQNETRL